MNEQEARELFINPYYAIRISSNLAVDHDTMVSKYQWIKVNAQLIDELGKEEWLKQLLSVLESDKLTPYPEENIIKKLFQENYLYSPTHICYYPDMETGKGEIIRKELGEKIRSAREKISLTQVEVAKAANMDVNYYARIERGLGNPSYEKLHNIMEALKLNSFDIQSNELPCL